MSTLRLAAFAVATVWAAVAPASSGDGSQICLECHDAERWGVAAHPLGMPIAGRLREDAGLPLGDGTLGCVTCHTFHGGGEPGADPAGRFWLRRAVPELCAACHAAAGGWDRGHARYGDTIHGGTRLAPVDEDRAALQGNYDDVSARCQACHAGGHGSGGRAIDAGISHPLANYGSARARNWQGYTPEDKLDRAVRLVDGRVSCVSCHRLYGSNPVAHRLVVSKKRGALCGRCHAQFS